jgi:hypothetical protein
MNKGGDCSLSRMAEYQMLGLQQERPEENDG